MHRKLYNHLSLLSILAILKIGQWSCFHLTLFSLMIQRNGKVSSKWWMLGANLSTNEWCFPLRRSHGPLDFLQWKTQALWFIGHENTFTILLIFPNAPLTTIFPLKRGGKKINFSTHILRLTLLPFCCTLCAAITIVGEDKFETFYAIFNLIDRIQCKWSKVCAAGREGSAQHGWRIIHREFPYFFTLFGFYGGRERDL